MYWYNKKGNNEFNIVAVAVVENSTKIATIFLVLFVRLCFHCLKPIHLMRVFSSKERKKIQREFTLAKKKNG